MVRRLWPSFVLALTACGDVAPLADADARTVDDPADVRGDDDTPAPPLLVTPLEQLPLVPLLGPPYPIVLVHGFSGWADAGPVEYFFGVKDDLEARGDDVTAPALPPYTTSQERARVLASVIDDVLARTHKAKVHLIGHSQGGVDIREVVVGMGYAPRVASVTTVSTPHQGTAVADLAASAPEGVLNPAGQLLAWLLGAAEGEPPSEASWASDETSDAWTPELAGSIEGLRPASMAAFVEAHPWPAELPVFSVAGVSNLLALSTSDCDGALWDRSGRVDDTDPIFVASGAYLNYTDGGDLFSPRANDGLVTVRSARDGVFLGCFPADHVDEIGQIVDLLPGLLSGFDHKELYRRLVDNARTVE